MKRLRTLAIAALLVPALALAADDITADTRQARATAAQLLQQLGGALKKELTAGGPESAIGVCKDLAPSIAGELSRQSGARVVRVSLRTRNPMLGSPDGWEQGVLAEFDRRAAAGDKPETLERAEYVEEPGGRYFRYMKAIPVQPLCMACHGPRDGMPAGVRERLAAEYPHDRAVGYGPGEIRGAVSVKKPY